MGDNADCLGVRTGDNVEFYTDDSNCAVSPTPNGTHIIYTSEIHSSRGMSNDIINRRQDLSMSWTCALEIDYMMSLTSGIATQMAQIEFELDDVEGTFEVRYCLFYYYI